MKLVLACLLVSAASCGQSKSDDNKAPVAKPTVAEPEPVKDPAKAPPPEPVKQAPKVPALSPLAFDAWGITIAAPAGTQVTDIDPGDAALKMPDNAKLSTEASCGTDIDIHRHWKKDLASFYDSAKKDELTDLKFLVDDKTDAAFKVHFTGKAPLGAMYGVDTGLVVGKRLILCSAGLNRMTEEEAACVFAVCSSMKAK